MFDNVQSLRMTDAGALDKSSLCVTGLISCENEIMEFRTTQHTSGDVEHWMMRVMNEMFVSNRYLTKKAIYEFGKTSRPR